MTILTFLLTLGTQEAAKRFGAVASDEDSLADCFLGCCDWDVGGGGGGCIEDEGPPPPPPPPAVREASEVSEE